LIASLVEIGYSNRVWRNKKAVGLPTASTQAPQVGLEPTTHRLTADCSAIELLRNIQLGYYIKGLSCVKVKRELWARRKTQYNPVAQDNLEAGMGRISAGQQIKQYVIQQKIGEGGMGSVYTAQQPAMNRIVVLKVLSAKIVKTPEMLRRFQREVEVIARLEHPYIVPVYDYGEIEDNPFVVMRYLPGGTLEDKLRVAEVDREPLLRSLEQVAEALDYAHERGVVHRDLKPGNILFDERGNAYLADFGIAKAMAGDQDLTATGGIVGTPAYMSPEQARGEKLDGRTDVYSLAVVAYQTLAGKLPFEAGTVWEWIDSHLAAPVPSILMATPGLPPRVDDVFQRGLAKEPAQRQTTATQFMRELHEALGGASLGTAPTSAEPAATLARPERTHRPSAFPGTVRQVASGGAAATAAAPLPEVRKPSLVPWLLLGLALLVLAAGTLLVVGSGAFLFSQRGRAPLVATYPAGDSPRAVLFDGESVWVANFFDYTVVRLQAAGCSSGSADPCGRPLGTYHLSNAPVSLAHDGRSLWVAETTVGYLTRLDGATGETVEQQRLPHLPARLLYHEPNLWVAYNFAGSVGRIDARDPATAARYDTDEGPWGLAFAGDRLWVSNQDGESIIEIDAARGEIGQRVSLPGRPGALAFDGRHLWVALEEAGQVAQLRPDDGSVVRRVATGQRPVDLLFDGRHLWVANEQSNSVSRIDVSSGRVIATFDVPGGPFALAWAPCGEDCADLWIAGQSGDTVSRLRVP
jgi:YVTN family beta-propeller protein